MKNRNVLLSLAIVLTAIGSAAASAFMTVTPLWIHGQYETDGGTVVNTCSTLTENICSTSGSFNCRVIVTITPGGTPTPANTIGYSNSSCTIPLKQSSAGAGFNATPDDELVSVRTYTPN